MASGASSYTCQPPQISSVDPQNYLGVVLVVVLVIANVDAPTFSGRPHVRILSLLFNLYFVIILVESVDANCAVVIAILIDSI